MQSNGSKDSNGGPGLLHFASRAPDLAIRRPDRSTRRQRAIRSPRPL